MKQKNFLHVKRGQRLVSSSILSLSDVLRKSATPLLSPVSPLSLHSNDAVRKHFSRIKSGQESVSRDPTFLLFLLRHALTSSYMYFAVVDYRPML